MMADASLVIRKLMLIGADREEIRKLGQRPLDEFLGDLQAQVLAERYLERVIGRMIDINYHLITSGGDPPPKDYYDSFVKLGALGVLPHDVARDLASSTGLRNRIAHEYDEIDYTRVHEGLVAAATRIPLYMRQVQARLNQPGN
jgi:uncharacterized protein YutE (UPF0331/DUF86 family)